MTAVLAAIDASDRARSVLLAAQSVAVLFANQVTALHVSDDDAAVEARTMAREAHVELNCVRPPVVDAIVDAANKPDIAAIVTGAKGTDGTGAPTPIGRTALAVIIAVEKPVLVVPSHWTPAPRIERILLPLEGSEESSHSVIAISERARSCGSEVVVLHVDPDIAPPPFQDQRAHATRAWAREFAARFVPPAYAEAKIIRRVGGPADHIARLAGELAADLVLLGWSQTLTGGHAQVVRDTLVRCSVPVMLVPIA